jgi:DNA-binding GntR family transcriptional regulator
MQRGHHLSANASGPVYDAVKISILSGEIEAGAPLRQDDIAKQFGVSKIPVREALRKLEIENLVIFEQNKGASVRHIPESEILQLFDIRIALECRALELAVPHMIDADFGALRKLSSDYAKKTDVKEWSAMNLQFHQMLYEPCGNPELIRMIGDLQDKLGKYLRLLVTEVSGLVRPMQEHEAILDACARGDGSQAVQNLRQHIETTKKEVGAFLRRKA